jgi:hypothetical protein
MINPTGVLAAMDHGVTINWDDGATLHKILAQVRYRVRVDGAVQTLRVNASSRSSDEPLCFVSANEELRASWTWQEHGPGFTAHLSVANESEDDVWLDALEVIRIDAAFGGLFNLGAPTGLWQIASGASNKIEWQQGSPATPNGFKFDKQMLIQPVASNRSSPPAVCIRKIEPPFGATTVLQLEIDQEKFLRFTAGVSGEAILLGAGVTIASPEFLIVSGDDSSELVTGKW